MVSLAYQAPDSVRKSPLPAWRLINANNALLSGIPTDRRPSPESSKLVAIFRRVFSEATFKLDYLSNEGWPNWLSPLDSVFSGVTSGLKIVGLHKYLHYRRWFQQELGDYIHNVITEARNRETLFWNPDFLKQMVEDHTSGRKNYVREINAVLTLDAVERLLFQGSAKKDRRLYNSRSPITSLAAAKSACCF
jgi:asparagine synthase (glutamine-hydrolysing)